MPISEMTFANGIFFAKESGHIDRSDAEQWAEAVRAHAEGSATPFVALVDALDVTFVSAAARMIFAEASKIENLQTVSVATSDMLTTQTARVIGMLGERGVTHVFATLEEAREYAEQVVEHLAQSR